jgi:hypothetical protein
MPEQDQILNAYRCIVNLKSVAGYFSVNTTLNILVINTLHFWHGSWFSNSNSASRHRFYCRITLNTSNMKKAVLFVAIFLMGMATQTFAQRHNNVVYNPGTNVRYYDAQEIRFVENGVLYSVATNGTFRFRTLQRPFTNSRRGYTTNYYGMTPGEVVYVNERHNNRSQIRFDRYGRIGSIGETLISYQRDGKVRSIGCVPLQYRRGSLIRVGNLEVIYNRRGMIRNTIGYVNRYNKQYWHEDWYEYYNDWSDDWNDEWNDDRNNRGDRKRNKKSK